MAEDQQIEEITDETPECLDTVLCTIGFSDEGRLMAIWSSEAIKKLRRSSSPEQIIKLIELSEQAMVEFISELCGGKQ